MPKSNFGVDICKIEIFDETLAKFVYNIKEEHISRLKEQLAVALADVPAQPADKAKIPKLYNTLLCIFIFPQVRRLRIKFDKR